MNVYYLTNAPTPYKQAFWNELGNYCNLTVLLEIDHSNERDKSWKTESEKNYTKIILPHLFRRASDAFCPSIRHYLKQINGIIIINGYSTLTGMYTILYCRIHHIPYIISADGGFINRYSIVHNKKILSDDIDNKKYKLSLIYFIKKFFIKGASGYLSSGTVTDDYLVYYGASRNKIGRYPFTSIRRIEILNQCMNEEEKVKLRSELGIKEKRIIITVGRFIPLKGFDILLKACANIDKDIGVYLIGGTPTEEYIQIYNELNLKNVHFLPFMSSNKLKKYYLASNLFVLPTYADVWGLVVNEAMACGLPVITTDKCVAGLEMIPGITDAGMIVQAGNVEEFSKAIELFMNNDQLRNHASEAALKKATEYTIENMALKHYEFLSIYSLNH